MQVITIVWVGRFESYKLINLQVDRILNTAFHEQHAQKSLCALQMKRYKLLYNINASYINHNI